MTDRLDSALYDKIKSYQAYYADAIRLAIFNELLREGGFDPIVNPKLEGVQDRSQLVFREIDLDTQIKKETHSIQKASTNLETIGESRLAMGLTPEMDEADTLAAMQVRLQPTTQIVSSKSESGATKSEVIDTTPEDAVKNGKQTPSKGGAPNAKNLKKGPANIIRPTNQQGTRTSPNVRHSDVDDLWTEDLLDILDKD